MSMKSDPAIRGVIFDMDGVLCNSEPFICEAACKMFEEVHRTRVQPDDFKPFVGTGEDRFIGGVAEKYGLQNRDAVAEKAATYRIYLEIIKGRLQPLAGVIDFVRACRAAGVKTAVASSADMIKVKGNLAQIGLVPERDFDAVVCGEDVQRKKPAPDIFLLAAKRIGIDPKECLVVEDAPSGVKAGAAAGARCLGITSSFTEATLREAGATEVLPDLRGAEKFISPASCDESDVLKQLVNVSRELGREDRHLAILGEGNTSADAGDGTFWVKGSGSRLATIRAEHFSRVRTADVLAMLDHPEATELEIEAALKQSLVDPSSLKPSIETILHAMCLTAGGARFVGHTHAEEALAILCSRHGAEPFRRHIFPDAVVVCGRVPMIVPYADPGMPLAIAFRDALSDYRAKNNGTGPKLVLMVNHGIVALGKTAQEILNVTLMAQKWARALSTAITLGGATYLPEESVTKLDSRLDEQYRRRILER